MRQKQTKNNSLIQGESYAENFYYWLENFYISGAPAALKGIINKVCFHKALDDLTWMPYMVLEWTLTHG